VTTSSTAHPPGLDFEGIEPTRSNLIVADGDLERLPGDLHRAPARLRIGVLALAPDLVAMEVDGQLEKSDAAVGTIIAQKDLAQTQPPFEAPPEPFGDPSRARQAGRGAFAVIGCFGKRRADQAHDRACQGIVSIGRD
jgi:hypothetical protein